MDCSNVGIIFSTSSKTRQYRQDNNASERGIRKLKIKLKNSGCFRSDLGADAFMDLHSIVETTKNTATRLSTLFSPFSKGDRLSVSAE